MYQNFDLEEAKDQQNKFKQGDRGQDQPIINPYYEDYLEPHQRGQKLPYVIRQWRNRCVVALILQTVASLSGLIMYSIRRIRIGQIVNIACLILIIFFGRGGVLTLNKMHTAIHAVLTSSVFGVVFLFSILEILFLRSAQEQSSEKLMLFIFCLPYVADFICGACCLYLSFLLFDYEKEETKLEIPELKESELCVICSSKKINTVFYTCGHKAACYECSLQIKKHYKMECPLCRKEIKDLIVVYEQ